MAIASFAPTAGAFISASAVSSNVLLPTTGTPTIALVTNMGDLPVFVALGASNVAAVAQTGQAILPHTSFALTIGTNTYLAAITLQGVAGLNISVGN